VKYIMLETGEGQKLPFLFPEAMTHAVVAEVVRIMLRSFHKQDAKVVSAGFVSLGLGAEVSGESESLGGVKSVPADAARIMVGESIAFMPDALAEMMLERLREQPG
jgi:hypothetical protein